ncbi:hypothetical protein FSP39_014739 [Pinctada imbricata]|uniref:Uncharacterized protein n=1 Tax=Pinctada imbricata TaxID=66713 RepID=A0AA88YGC9_PINIB|nr:hypothetical protein FSP39_014739 [Pinctada imbricata]
MRTVDHTVNVDPPKHEKPLCTRHRLWIDGVLIQIKYPQVLQSRLQQCSKSLLNMKFRYLNQHFLVARTSKYCYMLPITGMDQRAILTSAGLRSLEVRMYQMMDYAVHEALRGMDVIHLSPIVSKMCFNQTLVKIHD